MRYRVHKHCRRPDCTDWCVSTPRHTVIYTNQLWSAALDWALARVTREALTRHDNSNAEVDYFDSIVNATGMKVPEGFAGLAARAQIIWPKGVGFAHTDPLADARFAGQGEFATPGVGFSANSAILASSEPNLAGFVGDFDCNDVAENPKIVDTQQISDSGA